MITRVMSLDFSPNERTSCSSKGDNSQNLFAVLLLHLKKYIHISVQFPFETKMSKKILTLLFLSRSFFLIYEESKTVLIQNLLRDCIKLFNQILSVFLKARCFPVVLNSFHTWQWISDNLITDETKSKAAMMWFFQWKMLRIAWTVHATNTERSKEKKNY